MLFVTTRVGFQTGQYRKMITYYAGEAEVSRYDTNINLGVVLYADFTSQIYLESGQEAYGDFFQASGSGMTLNYEIHAVFIPL